MCEKDVMSFALRSAPIGAAPKSKGGYRKPSIAYRRRVAFITAGPPEGRFESAKFQDWHLVKLKKKRKELGPEFQPPGHDPEQEIHQERIEYRKQPQSTGPDIPAGFVVPVPIDAARRRAVELELRLCWLRFRFGKWDGKPRVTDESLPGYETEAAYAAKLAVADATWKQVQDATAARMTAYQAAAPPTDPTRKDIDRIFKSLTDGGTASLVGMPGEGPKVLEWEAHNVLPGYDYRATDSVKGSTLQGTSSQLKATKQRKPSAFFTAEYNAGIYTDPANFGYDLACMAWTEAQTTGIIDCVCDYEQTEKDKGVIKRREDGKAEQAANKAAGKARKKAASTGQAAAAAAGEAAHTEIRTGAEEAVRENEYAASEAGSSAKKHKKAAMTAEQQEELARKREEEKEAEAERQRSIQVALEAEAAAQGITVDKLRHNKRAAASAATRKLNEAQAAGFTTAEEFAKWKADKALADAAQKKIEREVGLEMNKLIRQIEKDAALAEKERIRLELEAHRERQAAYQDQLTEMYRLQGAWDEDDLNSYAHRQGLLNRMAELRYMHENMAKWTRECNEAWEAANARDTRKYQERVEWFKANVEAAAEGAQELVPPEPRSLKVFYDPYRTVRAENGGKIPVSKRLEAEPLDTKPHWFDALNVAAEAGKLAWDSAKAGACQADMATVGGRAVNGLCDVLLLQKQAWKPADIDVGTFQTRPAAVEFDWDSRGYVERVERGGDLQDTTQHGTIPTLRASTYRDAAGALDYKSVTYIDELPEEYYQIDRVEEDEDDFYDHIPVDDVRKYLATKMVNKDTGAKLKKTNSDRIREDIVADNIEEIRTDPSKKKLTESQINAQVLLQAKEELFDTGDYPRDAEEAVYGDELEDAGEEGDSGDGVRARQGAMLALRPKRTESGNIRYENGKPVWELADDPFIVVDDDEDMDGEEAEALEFLDRPAMIDGGHPIPNELLFLFPADRIERRDFDGEVVNLVTQPTPIRKSETEYYTNEEWLAYQQSVSDGVPYEQALANARARRTGTRVAGSKRKVIELSDAGKALAVESGAYIKKSKVQRYLRLLTGNAAQPSQSNNDRITAELTATGQIGPATGTGMAQDLIETQARKEMAGQEGYESDESVADSAANSEGLLGEDDRFGEAGVKDVEIEEADIVLEEQGAADVDGMDDFLNGPDDAGPSAPVPAPVPGAPATEDDEMPQAPAEAAAMQPWNLANFGAKPAFSHTVDAASQRFSRLAMGMSGGKNGKGARASHWSLR